MKRNDNVAVAVSISLVFSQRLIRLCRSRLMIMVMMMAMAVVVVVMMVVSLQSHSPHHLILILIACCASIIHRMVIIIIDNFGDFRFVSILNFACSKLKSTQLVSIRSHIITLFKIKISC